MRKLNGRVSCSSWLGSNGVSVHQVIGVRLDQAVRTLVVRLVRDRLLAGRYNRIDTRV